MPRIDGPAKLAKALSDRDIPKVYANNFDLALGTGDIAVILKNGQETVAVMNLSYTVAKTLSVKIQELIRVLEERLGHAVMTSDEINKCLASSKRKGPTLQ